MIKAGIIGATGYAGAELVRILHGHPKVQIAAISSVSFKGQPLSQVYPAFLDINDMICETEDEVIAKSDVVFAALPHGLSQPIAAKTNQKGKAFVDLGADFRLEDEDEYKSWYDGVFTDTELHKQAVYGLSELFSDDMKGKKIVANPGCYTTAVPLALAPAIINGFVEITGIIADCKSGVTGAGRALTQGTHFADLNEGMHAYKVAAHRHTPEIEQTLSKIAGKNVKVTFVPHLIPVNRGILATCYARLKPQVKEEDIRKAYEDYYKDKVFVRLLPKGANADIHNIKYSNYCDISLHIDKRTDTLIAVSALDNMVKGAAGQAVQNMNIIFGLEETMGLEMVPPAF